MAQKNKTLIFLLVIFGLAIATATVASYLRPSSSVVEIAANAMAKQMNRKVKNFRGVIVYWQGQKIIEHYGGNFSANRYQRIASVTKGLASTACGFAVQEGFLRLDDRVIDFFPEITIAEGSLLKQLTVRDLLMLRSGYDSTDEAVFFNDIAALFEREPSLAPGEKFVYGHISCLLISSIISRVTGRTIEGYLRPRLFVPLGIYYYGWEEHDNISCAATGVHMTLPDLVKIGEFYRQRGEWENLQLLNGAWFDNATSNQSPEAVSGDDNWSSGFGYLFWRNKFGGFRSDGSGGQLLVVLPEEEITIALFSNSNDFNIPLGLIEKFVMKVRN